MAHIKRIDLTRDVKAHEDAYREAIEKVCRETAFPEANMQMHLTRNLLLTWAVNMPAV